MPRRAIPATRMSRSWLYERLSLARLIMLFGGITLILTLVSSMYAGWKTQREMLLNSTLETNRVYASKLALSVNSFFSMAESTLRYSAAQVNSHLQNPVAMQSEIDRILNQNQLFNSVAIADIHGKVLSIAPQSLNKLVGKVLDSPGMQEALTHTEGLAISKPYQAGTGRYLVMVSYPLRDKAGKAIGIIYGTLYLQQPNVLNTLLGEHFYQDGSYIYAVDSRGILLYHQNGLRVGESVATNRVVQKIMEGKSGAERTRNTQNKDMLAGFAYIPEAGWGVVVQRPTEMALAPATTLLLEMIRNALPFLLIAGLLSWWLARHIAQPLHDLSRLAKDMSHSDTSEQLAQVSSWYAEARHLKRALLSGIKEINTRLNRFRRESNTDPLTGLANRRAMNELLEHWEQTQQSFAIIIVDIDRFKSVNDTYGHHVGDEVLRFLAQTMLNNARDNDICCRFGGEEFVILLPNTDLEHGLQAAERLRKRMATQESPCGKVVTISAGVGHFPQTGATLSVLFERTDQALYGAKHNGRNRVEVANEATTAPEKNHAPCC